MASYGMLLADAGCVHYVVVGVVWYVVMHFWLICQSCFVSLAILGKMLGQTKEETASRLFTFSSPSF